jgi:4-amino-4-deoxy-L-arabinose transferase-like glycosyltransferase
MRGSFHNKPSRLELLLASVILLVALWVRIPNIGQGLPYIYDEDEGHHFNRVVEMVKEGRYDPQYFLKPSLHFYLRMPVTAAGFLWGVREGQLKTLREIKTRNPFGLAGYSYTASHPVLVKSNRAFSLLCAMVTIFCAMVIVRILLPGALAWLVTGLILALSPALVSSSTIIGVESPLAALVMLTVLTALRAENEHNIHGGTILLTGLLAGLAVSTKYNIAPIVFVPLLLALMGSYVSTSRVAVALISPVVGFLAGSPFILTSLPLFLDHLAYEIWHYGIAGHEGHTGEPGLSQAIFYFTWFKDDALGVLALAFAILGIFFLVAKNRRQAALLLVFPVLYFLLMITQRANFTRNMLVIIPFVAILAGFGIAAITRFWNNKFSKVLMAIAILAIVYLPASWTLQYQNKISEQTESRRQLGEQLPTIINDGEAAIDGELQMPTSQLSRSTIVAIHASSPQELFNSGFSHLAVSSSSKIGDWKLTPLKSLAGEEKPQRIPNNPAIEIYALNDPSLKESAINNAWSETPAIVVSAMPDQKVSCNVKDKNYLDDLGDHKLAWTDKRAIKISIQDGASVKLLSPWPNSTIEIYQKNNPTPISQSSLEAGKWFTFIPPAPGEYLVYSNIVASPKNMGVNDDQRRLGLAIYCH